MARFTRPVNGRYLMPQYTTDSPMRPQTLSAFCYIDPSAAF